MRVKTMLLGGIWASMSVAGALAQEQGGALTAVPFEQLSDKAITIDGRRALAIRPTEWKHAETPHYVLHFFHSFIAAPVSLEAEFYFRYILADLGVNEQDAGTALRKGKVHVYLFEKQEDWSQFRQTAFLESWTGAVHIDGALFVPRYPEFKWKGNALGHEIAHELVSRYIGTRLPLWLKEGYAEDVSTRGYSTFHRARGYFSLPRASQIPSWIPLARLTTLTAYPGEAEVASFYAESHALCLFFGRDNGHAPFVKLLTQMAQGMPFPMALREAYGSRWISLDTLETEFKKHLDGVAPR